MIVAGPLIFLALYTIIICAVTWEANNCEMRQRELLIFSLLLCWRGLQSFEQLQQLCGSTVLATAATAVATHTLACTIGTLRFGHRLTKLLGHFGKPLRQT